MKSFTHFIKEHEEKILEGAPSRPSGIRKYKGSSRKETVHFKSGDVYDLSDPGYDEEFKYYDGSGNGYIKDKEGHVYDVVTYNRQGDAGRIAGGSTSFGVTIKKANGKDDFTVSGFIAVFSNGWNVDCVADIEAGYYLEDYIAKYIVSSQEKAFGEIAKKGDKNAKSFDQGKAEKKAQREASFKERYAIIPKVVYWEVNSKGFDILKWSPSDGREGEEYANTKAEKESTPYFAKDENGNDNFKEKNKVWQELDKQMKDIKSRLDAQYLSVFKPTLENSVKYIFKTSDVNTLKGIAGTFNVKGNRFSRDSQFAIDTKTNKIVSIDAEKSRVTNDDLEYAVGDIISINKSDISPEMEKLFKAVSKAWMKVNGKKQTEYIANNWERIHKESSPYWNNRISKGDAKVSARKEYQDMVNKHDWDKSDKLQFSLSLIKDYVEGDLPNSDGPVEKPLSNPEPEKETKERGKNTKMNKNAEKAAYDKMTAWHEGKRKQNLANCSDAKLKMNYRICKELGYENEMDLLSKEAEKRGIDINESLSFAEFISL